MPVMWRPTSNWPARLLFQFQQLFKNKCDQLLETQKMTSNRTFKPKTVKHIHMEQHVWQYTSLLQLKKQWSYTWLVIEKNQPDNSGNVTDLTGSDDAVCVCESF